MAVITKEILVSLRNGDHDAFEAVFVSYFNRVKYFINGFVKSMDDAEELAQDIFVKIWTNREVIDPERNFNTYIYVSARNTTLNFLKKKYIRDSYASDTVKTESEFSNDTEETLFAREIGLLIQMAVAKMPEKRREIYEMSRNGGLTNDEIAERLNISKKTVENQMSLALKELKNIVSLFVMLFLG